MWVVLPAINPMSKPTLRMRLAHPDDAREVGLLVRCLVRRWIIPDQPLDVGKDLLARSSARSLREKIIEGQRFHLAYIDDVLVGVSAMRDDSHLVQFFVSTRFQGFGIGRRLWERTMRDATRRAGTRRFTLNATRCAVPVYLRLGFRATGREQPSPLGVLTTPMALMLPLGRGKGA
jgi:GNAT superfamily N-acetyltransferase